MNEFTDLGRFDVDISDHIAIVTMNHPPVNAQDRRLREQLIRVFDILGEREDVRAIVLTGAGKVFSAGADLKERSAISEKPGALSRHNRLVRAMLDAVMECPKPVIAAINGAAIGGGCVLALVCDIVIVAEEAHVAMTEVKVGMAGGVRHAMRAFSPSDARFMIYTAKRVGGSELLRMNVASACVPKDKLMDKASEIARSIAEKAPLAIEAAKRSFDVTEEMPLREGYRYEQGQTAVLTKTEDTQEAGRAFREKREPTFHRR